MVLMLEMVEILVDLEDIKENVVVAVDLDIMAAVAAVVTTATALVVAVEVVQELSTVLGLIQYLKMDRMDKQGVEVL